LPPHAVNWWPLDLEKHGTATAVAVIALSVLLNAVAMAFST